MKPLQGEKKQFLCLFVERRKMAHLVLTKASCNSCHALSPGDTHPPLPVPPFLLVQNRSSKRIMPAENMLPKLHSNYRTRSNLWNVLIIETPNFNYVIRSNSWNGWIFEINNHSNRSNGQVLLSFIFSCYKISSHGMLRTMESSICLEWVESAVAFRIYFTSASQKMLSNNL